MAPRASEAGACSAAALLARPCMPPAAPRGAGAPGSSLALRRIAACRPSRLCKSRPHVSALLILLGWFGRNSHSLFVLHTHFLLFARRTAALTLLRFLEHTQALLAIGLYGLGATQTPSALWVPAFSAPCTPTCLMGLPNGSAKCPCLQILQASRVTMLIAMCIVRTQGTLPETAMVDFRPELGHGHGRSLPSTHLVTSIFDPASMHPAACLTPQQFASPVRPPILHPQTRPNEHSSGLPALCTLAHAYHPVQRPTTHALCLYTIPSTHPCRHARTY
jgi:hypothetical protein